MSLEKRPKIELIAYCSSIRCSGSITMVRVDAGPHEIFCANCGEALYWLRHDGVKDLETMGRGPARSKKNSKNFFVKKAKNE